ncbi:MAG TPA: hypothetical protein PLA46_01215 [Phycicoccus sp.]|jgi:hypothetical protein|nr:hypothetical protein [Phycicoccus sp.]HQH06187.1 hypothetical protein [Phycicoccus sp.]HQK31318.1 hypothetical protein [Phycicoccus sp.]HQV90169.1 hypothetical protein [Phycicoccus sp.]HQY95515.1 hypothetical protein [Phycicoccus sp.]
MTTHRTFSLEAAHKVADRIRNARRQSHGWDHISDRDLERVQRELRAMSQASPRIF